MRAATNALAIERTEYLVHEWRARKDSTLRPLAEEVRFAAGLTHNEPSIVK